MKALTLLVVTFALSTLSCSIENSLVASAPQLGAFENSSPIFRDALRQIEKNPDSPAAHTSLAMLYMKESRKTGDFSLNAKAESAVSRALEISPGDATARKLRASLHLANHRFTQAVEAATALRDEFPGDPFIHGVLADAYIEIGQYEKAVEASQKMVDLKPGTASYSRVAQLRTLYGDHRGALEMFTKAARSADPTDKETQSWCLVQLGDEYWKAGNYAEAERIYDEALENFPGYFFATVSKGRLRASLGDYETAERLLTEVQIPGPNAKAMLMLGDIYTVRGDADRARKQYEAFEAFEKDLGDAADHNRLALSLVDRGRVDEALTIARKEYANEPSIYSADLLAWCLYKTGDIKGAKVYMREAMRLKTRDARIWFHAGMIANADGDRREAVRSLNAALALNPGFDIARAREARSVLASLRSRALR